MFTFVQTHSWHAVLLYMCVIERSIDRNVHCTWAKMKNKIYVLHVSRLMFLSRKKENAPQKYCNFQKQRYALSDLILIPHQSMISYFWYKKSSSMLV
jgi:hypothetical protein